MSLFPTLLAAVVAAMLVFTTSASANHDLDDIAACGGRVAHAPREVRRALNRCVRLRRAGRAIAERDRLFALHRGPRASLVLGYDGTLLWYGELAFSDGPAGRYRTPSFLVGFHVRGNFLNRMGAFVTLAPTLGAGNIGGRDLHVGAKHVGRVAAGTLETGFSIGPFRRLFFTAGAQMRVVIPRTRQATFYIDDTTTIDTVRWNGLLLGIGPRLAANVMFGREHETYLEVGIGGGALVGRSAGYVTLGARVGHSLGR